MYLTILIFNSFSYRIELLVMIYFWRNFLLCQGHPLRCVSTSFMNYHFSCCKTFLQFFCSAMNNYWLALVLRSRYLSFSGVVSFLYCSSAIVIVPNIFHFHWCSNTVFDHFWSDASNCFPLCVFNTSLKFAFLISLLIVSS